MQQKAGAEWKPEDNVSIAMNIKHARIGDIVSSRVKRVGFISQLEIKIPAGESSLEFQSPPAITI